MPQISQLMQVYGSQFFWLLIVIGIIYFGIARNMVPKISKTVDDRQQRITDDLAAAQAARDKAEKIEEEYRQKISSAQADAVGHISAARAEATKKNDVAVKAAEAAIGQKIEAADVALKAAQADAMQEIEQVAVEAAQAIVATISGTNVSATEAQKAVKAAF